ncbi:Uncharacterised protein [Vibrio cholerae]|nr:hypothetical protein VC95412_000812 [Vibrio cholerae O1 str. 95412]CSD15098.1 Uncharacterised protein [Vibrio cholerae]
MSFFAVFFYFFNNTLALKETRVTFTHKINQTLKKGQLIQFK